MTADGHSGTMRERAEGSTAKLWLLLQADRWLVTLAIAAFLFLGVVAAGMLDPTVAQQRLADGDPMETLAQALVTSTVTGVTLVLTLSQLVLSQEQGAVGDQRDRMDAAMQFRTDVATVLERAVSPAEPSTFFTALIGATERQAAELVAAVETSADATVLDRVTTLADRIHESGEQARAGLEDANFGTFEVIQSALGYNYSWKLYAARRLRATHEDDLTPAGLAALDSLIETLERYGPAREHFKTLYFQWELMALSRRILWVSLPSLVVSTWALLFFEANTGRVLFGIPYSVLQVAAVVAISLLPFAVLLAYILRIVTVTKRTLSIGPFILRETDRDVDSDW